MGEKLTVSQTLAFFASVIKCGEPWTPTCQEAYENASALLSHPVPDAGWRFDMENAPRDGTAIHVQGEAIVHWIDGAASLLMAKGWRMETPDGQWRLLSWKPVIQDNRQAAVVPPPPHGGGEEMERG
jgi:hypothetical protein